jgi:DNA-binding transcriptional LysR family regulator
MRYTLSQIEAFYWVAKLSGFRAASQRMHLSQPTISHRISQLEKALGGRLFDRSGYRPVLTGLGVGVFDRAEMLLSLTDEIATHARNPDPLRGTLRIGAADSFAISHLPQLLASLEDQHPLLDVDVSVNFSAVIEKQLRDKELDIAFVTNPARSRSTVALPLYSIDLVWAMAPRIITTRLGASVTPRDLARKPILTNPAPSNLHTSIYDWFATAGLTPSRTSTCNPLHVLVRLAAAGFGATLLPPEFLSHDVARGTLKQFVPDPPIPPHELFAVYKSGREDEGIKEVVNTAALILGRTR